MHLCYVDDSGDSRSGVTLTALIVADDCWSGVLNAWLDGRRQIHQTFGVPKLRELHASPMYKGRGELCETPAQNKACGTNQRAAIGRIMLSSLAKHANFSVVTLATAEVVKPKAYAKFVAWLEAWAMDNDTYLLIFYDGQQGLDHPNVEHPSLERRRDLWETAIRDATPYREVHRGLDIQSRRVVEDVIMQDSRYNQLIQAVDLVAYGAYQKHLQGHPEIWGTRNTASAAPIRAYMQLAQHWSSDSDYGVYWLD